MKFSESWLREWVNPVLTTEALCDRLTMAGLEVESCEPVAAAFTDVVVGEVLSKNKHPQADRLNVCEVSIGEGSPLQIVCGASNVRVGMKAPVAKIGAVLPNITIKAAKLRGVESQGMMCSATELGLAEESEGLLVLADDAPLGMDFRQYWLLEDHLIDVSITPNRGDCLSIQGMAREVSALTEAPLTSLDVDSAVTLTAPAPAVKVLMPKGCPRYLGRYVRGVNAQAPTPIWMKERLRRGGIRSINVIVDVTNYVMLELGQPMHAFDADVMHGGITVRSGKGGESITLLDGSETTLNSDTMIIADDKYPLAIAGVMGGLASSVVLSTTNILLESAYFTPKVIAKQRQAYQLNSDSAYRFERGIDPTLQRLAIERAAGLIIRLAGGQAGAIAEVASDVDLPASKSIFLSESILKNVLGVLLPASAVSRVFKALAFPHVKRDDGWTVVVPAYRSDISLPEDLIEEVARIHGYEHIPVTELPQVVSSRLHEDSYPMQAVCRDTLTGLGLHEIIAYSFVAPTLQQLLDPTASPEALMNPMTAEMAVMRTSLWPGLIETLRYNQSRQQQRVRLFEIGKVFVRTDEGLTQPTFLGGLIAGDDLPLQWSAPARAVDFFDMKGIVESCLVSLCPGMKPLFTPAAHPALHPGQSADIRLGDVVVGWVGALHPQVKKTLDISTNVYLFELNLNKIPATQPIKAESVSKFPEIRRDLALLVDQTIPSQVIQDTIRTIAGDWLKTLFVFDIYQGKGVASEKKSVAVALLLQHPTRTLVDDEVAALIENVVAALKSELGVELRS